MDDLKQARDGDAFTDCSRLFQTEIPVTNGQCLKHSVFNFGVTSELTACLVL